MALKIPDNDVFNAIVMPSFFGLFLLLLGTFCLGGREPVRIMDDCPNGLIISSSILQGYFLVMDGEGRPAFPDSDLHYFASTCVHSARMSYELVLRGENDVDETGRGRCRTGICRKSNRYGATRCVPKRPLCPA